MRQVQKNFSFILLMISMLLLISACESSSVQNEPNETQDTKELQQESDETLTNFINYDELSEKAQRLTTLTGVDYSNEELELMKTEDWRKNLDEVVQEFAKNKLLTDISFMKSVPGTYNPRSVMIGNTKGDVYRVDFVKRHNMKGIWTAVNFGLVNESNVSKIYEPIHYNTIRLEEADTKVQEWAKRILKKEQGAEEVWVSGNENIELDKTYILLVAESNASIEIIDIRAGDQMISINYANAFPDEEFYGREPYVLLEFESPAIDIFIRKYSSTQVNDIRPYM